MVNVSSTDRNQALAVTYECCLFSFLLPGVILLTINQDIGPSNNIAWVATSWALASAVVMTIAGRCSDIFGRRNFFLTGNFLGVIGCAIACRATNVSTLILGSSFLVSKVAARVPSIIDRELGSRRWIAATRICSGRRDRAQEESRPDLGPHESGLASRVSFWGSYWYVMLASR